AKTFNLLKQVTYLPIDVACCEIAGVRDCGSLPLGFSSREPPPSLYAPPVVKNLPRKAHKDPLTAEVCTL
ncbi:Hypothetical protein FKW44_021126, partial [Caligus rogercresseyi]